MPYVIVKPPSKVERDPWGTGRVRVQLSYAGTDIPVTHNTIVCLPRNKAYRQ